MDDDPLIARLGRARPAAAAVDPTGEWMLGRLRASLFGLASEPPRLGRFTILESIGAGGMGAVYAAYDPVLDRRVAIKLLRSADARTHDRLVREARALAKLAHPNVVAVHDAGTVDDVVYIAMELVDGETVGAWARARDRGWRAIVRVFADAARGLAAAHAAGVIHGDVKPDNLVIGHDGRVRVVDFGLARDRDAAPDAGIDAGVRGGTPAYMAPEVLAGAPASERADQYGWCVALYEAIHGERPPGDGGRGAPAWVRRLLARGLAADPEARHRSLAELADAIDHRLRAGRWRWLAIGAACAAAAGGAAWVATRRVEAAGAIEPCDADVQLGEAWSAGRRAAVAGAVPVALAGVLDAYAADWRAGYLEACRATRVRGVQSVALLDLRVVCLERRRGELAALTEVLAAPGAEAARIDRAAEAAWRLAPVAECADVAALAAGPALPAAAAERARLAAIGTAAAGARALFAVGRYREAREAAEPLVAQVAEPTHAATRAAVMQLVADARHALGELAAEEVARRAEIRAASAARDVVMVAGGWLDLADLVAEDPARGAIASELAEVAAAQAAALPPGHLFEALLATFHGRRAQERGDHAAAIAHHQRALERRERALSPEHPDVALSLESLAEGYLGLGDHARAIAVLERALAIRTRAFGDDHPAVAVVLASLGIAWTTAGDYTRARTALERSIRIQDRRVGGDPHKLAYSLKGLGDVLGALGEHAAALVQHRRALAVWEVHGGVKQRGAFRVGVGDALAATGERRQAREVYDRACGELRAALGADHYAVAGCLHNLANVLADDGQLAAARGHLIEVVAAFERTLGRDHPGTAVGVLNLARIEHDLGHAAVAWPLFRRAIAALEAAHGPDHPDLGEALGELGAALVGTDPRGAIAPLERACRILAAAGGSPALLGKARFALVRALWQTGGRARARAVAAEAGGEERAKLERWLVEHP